MLPSASLNIRCTEGLIPTAANLNSGQGAHKHWDTVSWAIGPGPTLTCTTLRVLLGLSTPSAMRVGSAWVAVDCRELVDCVLHTAEVFRLTLGWDTTVPGPDLFGELKHSTDRRCLLVHSVVGRKEC